MVCCNHVIAIEWYLRGDYEEMLATAQRATIDGSGVSWPLVSIADRALGQKDEALKCDEEADAYRRTMQRKPTWLVEVSISCAWRAAGR